MKSELLFEAIGDISDSTLAIADTYKPAVKRRSAMWQAAPAAAAAVVLTVLTVFLYGIFRADPPTEHTPGLGTDDTTTAPPDHSATSPTTDPTEPDDEPHVSRRLPPFVIHLGDLRGATSIRDALVEHIGISKAIADGRMSADTVTDSYLYSDHRIAEITEFYFPTIEIDGFELSSVTIRGGEFSFRYTPIGDRAFNIDTGVALRVTRTDAEFDDVPNSPTLEDLQKVFVDSRIADGLLFRATGEIVGVVGETWFTLITFPLDNDAAIDIATRFAQTAERITFCDEEPPATSPTDVTTPPDTSEPTDTTTPPSSGDNDTPAPAPTFANPGPFTMFELQYNERNIVISGGKEYTALNIFSHGGSACFASDCKDPESPRYMTSCCVQWDGIGFFLRNSLLPFYAYHLPPVPPMSDFRLNLDPDITIRRYTLYDTNFNVVSSQDSFTSPTERGEYLLEVSISQSWSDEYQYGSSYSYIYVRISVL
jgi:hypothetical protein